MRYQGRITEWKDERGFGFIAPNGGGSKIFLHVKAFHGGQPRPQVGDLVTYEVVDDPKRGPRANDVRYVAPRTLRAPATPRRSLAPAIALFVAVGVGAYAWRHYTRAPVPDGPPTVTESISQSEPAIRFSCQGKQYCSQMVSCEEATFYLKNCPNVKIDGDGDGIPCEEQWCGGR
jgi:cold shock CspA family protein